MGWWGYAERFTFSGLLVEEAHMAKATTKLSCHAGNRGMGPNATSSHDGTHCNKLTWLPRQQSIWVSMCGLYFSRVYRLHWVNMMCPTLVWSLNPILCHERVRLAIRKWVQGILHKQQLQKSGMVMVSLIMCLSSARNLVDLTDNGSQILQTPPHSPVPCQQSSFTNFPKVDGHVRSLLGDVLRTLNSCRKTHWDCTNWWPLIHY